MELKVKKPDIIVPSYSLTGDLLAYLRCRLQYRYHNGSSLPPSRPVQLWFGLFLHGTLEMAYRFWRGESSNGLDASAFPWPCTKREWRQSQLDWEDPDIGKFADSVENSLAQQGIHPRSASTRDAAYRRVELAVNEIGPRLFPLIASAERKVIGTRPVPKDEVELRCDKYEVHGVIDVLTNVTLSQAASDNIIRQRIQEACPDLQGKGTFEVVVDYKGARRPLKSEPFWDQHNWQIQTYAWLRERQPDSLPVAAGILIYINELSPGEEEMRSLKSGLDNATTDVGTINSQDAQIVRMWRPGMDTSQLSMDFRLRRAIRVVPVSKESVNSALAAFDDVVRRAEEDIASESIGQNILKAWSPNCDDSDTCAACDWRRFCPKPAGNDSENYRIKAPTAP